MIQPKVGQRIVDDHGISKVIQTDDWGGYTSELIIPKETFIEAYKEWIVEESDTIPLEEYNEILNEIKAEVYAKSEVITIPTDYILPKKVKIISLDDVYKIIDDKHRRR